MDDPEDGEKLKNVSPFTLAVLPQRAFT